jgi:hypothetical protein
MDQLVDYAIPAMLILAGIGIATICAALIWIGRGGDGKTKVGSR